jgi:hypothetical protein
MFYLHVTQSYDGKIEWNHFDGSESEEGLALCFHPSHKTRIPTKRETVQAVKQMITGHSLLWAQPEIETWNLDLDTLLKCNFASELRAKHWNWLQGTVSIRPEVEEMLASHDWIQNHFAEKGSLTVVFYLTPETVERNRAGFKSQKNSKRRITSRNAAKVFISHSSGDESLVESVTELLRVALRLSAKEILCTSIAGHKLSGGADTEEELIAALTDAPLLIGILTPVSLASSYVLFELGARWVLRKPLIALTGCGTAMRDIKEPLRSKNALNAALSADVYQLVEDSGKILRRRLEPANAYSRHVSRVVAAAKREQNGKQQRGDKTPRAVENQSDEQLFKGSDLVEIPITVYFDFPKRKFPQSVLGLVRSQAQQELEFIFKISWEMILLEISKILRGEDNARNLKVCVERVAREEAVERLPARSKTEFICEIDTQFFAGVLHSLAARKYLKVTELGDEEWGPFVCITPLGIKLVSEITARQHLIRSKRRTVGNHDNFVPEGNS